MRPLQPAERVIDDARRRFARAVGAGRVRTADPDVVDVEEETVLVGDRRVELIDADLGREQRRAAAAADLELVDEVRGQRRAQVRLHGVAVGVLGAGVREPGEGRLTIVGRVRGGKQPRHVRRS